jgi:FeS assembly protein IscX
VTEPINWDSTYALALALRREHPDVDLSLVSLGQVYAWALALPEFDDDPALANDGILAEIYQNWLEEDLDDIQ